MKIAIIGSRTFPQLKLVEWFIKDLPKGITIISGGAKGVDQYALKTAREYGFDAVEILPDLTNCKEPFEFTRAYYQRNQIIADECDLLVAFTEKQRGGTWDTIKRARKANKPVKIIEPCLLFPGIEDQDNEKEEEENGNPQRIKGKGPFQLKRISLGSYALRLWRYLDKVEWVDFLNEKETNPSKCAERMIPDFISFFKNNSFGKVHAITQAPRSIRNIGKTHPMDLVCQAVSRETGIPYVEMFEPWNKNSRGRHADHPDITIKDSVKDYLGKVVFILDDVTTTNKTLKTAVGSLAALGIHTHGLAWVFYS
jgi:phosphoribosylpyrophosphate synthetase